ncbi:Brp/Blh family beta-carotene 15,15'-dioxygenase [Haloglomus litoreum]|uniref:Brp/Blh family beta-carotene 15,15'-dioxygenase n=1 Tax=Haloglomus litoreum TaxID=3034026 RepID=UPI0023E83F49|nr:Brp/Blh family beta-carotene 15,15'-dioxygenase [Haloglomus sp. DT116]
MYATRVRDLLGGSVASTVLTISRAALVGVAVLFAGLRLAGRTPSLPTQAAIYLVGMVALNLPHGGYEHFANLRRRAHEFRYRYVVGYLAMAAAFAGLFLLAPVAGLALAVTVAVLKGGGGDLYVLRATTGTSHLRSRPQRLLAVAARGGAVMAVPIVAFPGTFRAFGAMMVAMVDPGALAPAASHFDTTRWLVGGGYGAVVLAHLGWGFHTRTGDGAWLADAAETLLLVAYFTVVPVVVAVGLYFPLWYSLRQVARELAVEAPALDGPDLLGGDAASAGAVALRAWGVLVAGALATAAVAVGFSLALPNPLPTGSLYYDGVAFWSVFISVVALPHVVVGAVLDRDRGIWHVP